MRISDFENPEELVCVSIDQHFDAVTFAALFVFQRRAVFMPDDLVQVDFTASLRSRFYPDCIPSCFSRRPPYWVQDFSETLCRHS